MNYPAYQFPARLSSLTEVLTYVATICKRAGLHKNEQLRVELVIEELFTNTVRHGYEKDCDHPVWIAANVNNKHLNITYQDAAPPYNPLNTPPNHDSSAIGGQGITLIKSFAHISYLHENGHNVLNLTFQSSE